MRRGIVVPRTVPGENEFMVDWYSAFIVAAAGLTSVFLVLLLLLVSMKAVGAVLARMAPKETEKKR